MKTAKQLIEGRMQEAARGFTFAFEDRVKVQYQGKTMSGVVIDVGGNGLIIDLGPGYPKTPIPLTIVKI